MFKKRVVGFIISVILVWGCTEDEEVREGQNFQDFWQGVTQEVDQRSNKGRLAVNDSLLLSERYGILNASSLMMNGENLYIEDQAQQEILLLISALLVTKQAFHHRKVAGLKNLRSLDHLMWHLRR